MLLHTLVKKLERTVTHSRARSEYTQCTIDCVLPPSPQCLLLAAGRRMCWLRWIWNLNQNTQGAPPHPSPCASSPGTLGILNSGLYSVILWVSAGMDCLETFFFQYINSGFSSCLICSTDLLKSSAIEWSKKCICLFMFF